MSAGATAAAATPPLPAAVREKEGERAATSEFRWDEGESREEDEGRFKHVSITFSYSNYSTEIGRRRLQA